MGRLDKTDTIECIVLDNNCSDLKIQKLTKSGRFLYDDMVGEAYAILTKSKRMIHKNKAKITYIIDRETGVTCDLIKEVRHENGHNFKDRETITDLGIFKTSLLKGNETATYKIAGVAMEIERDDSLLKLQTNPAALGRFLSWEFISRLLNMRPARWQLIVVAIIAFLIGLAM